MKQNGEKKKTIKEEIQGRPFYTQLELPNLQGGFIRAWFATTEDVQIERFAYKYVQGYKKVEREANHRVIQSVVIQIDFQGEQLQSEVYINDNSDIWFTVSGEWEGGKEAFESDVAED